MLCSVSLFLMNIFSWLAAFIQIPSVIFDLDAKCGGFPSYEIVFTHNSYSNFIIHRVWGRKNVHQWIGIIYIPGMDLPFGVWNICTCIKSWNISNLTTKGIFRIYWDQITWWKTQVFSMIQHETLYYWQHSLYFRCFSTDFAVWKNATLQCLHWYCNSLPNGKLFLFLFMEAVKKVFFKEYLLNRSLPPPPRYI